jgi:histidinol dehydrogenase
MTFLKRSSTIALTSSAFKKGAPEAYRMALTEGLVRHAGALSVRTLTDGAGDQ